MSNINLGGYNFDGPHDYDNTNFTDGYQCVYAVLDIHGNPAYIGKTDNLKERMANHHKKDCWRNKCSSNSVYVHGQVFDPQRSNIEETLINYYKPACNEILYDPFSS